jgi:hypothetical protein
MVHSLCHQDGAADAEGDNGVRGLLGNGMASSVSRGKLMHHSVVGGAREARLVSSVCYDLSVDCCHLSASSDDLDPHGSALFSLFAGSNAEEQGVNLQPVLPFNQCELELACLRPVCESDGLPVSSSCPTSICKCFVNEL